MNNTPNKQKTVPVWVLNLIASLIGTGLICLLLTRPKSYFVWILVLVAAIFILLQYFHPSYKYWRAAKRMFATGTFLALLPSIELLVPLPENGFFRFVDGASVVLSILFVTAGLVLSWLQYKSEKLPDGNPANTTSQNTEIHQSNSSNIFSGVNADKFVFTVGVSNENHGELLSITSNLIEQNAELQKKINELSTDQSDSEAIAIRLIGEIRQARVSYDFQTASQKSEALESTYEKDCTSWSKQTRRDSAITIAESLQNKIVSMEICEERSDLLTKLKKFLDDIDAS